MPITNVNGIELYHEEQGTGAPILCIHGTSSSAVVWGDAVAELASRGRTIVYDRRGCFRSERPEPYVTNVPEHADDAAALLDALRATPAVVIGRSYGGNVAIDLARRYPDRARALVLLEGAPITLSEGALRWWAEVEQQVFAAAEDDMDTVAETLLRNVLGPDAWDSFPEPVQQMFTGNGPAIVAELRAGDLEVTVEQLAGITHRTLLVAGEDSPAGFVEATELLAATMPAAELEWVGGGHLINPAHPAVLAFIDRVLAEDAPPAVTEGAGPPR